MNFAESLVWASVAADLVMQSFRHTAAYPKPVDVVTHHTLSTLFEPVEAFPCVQETAFSIPG